MLIDLNRFLLIPFKDGGRDFRGCDCWGLTRLVFAAFGRELPDYRIGCDDHFAIAAETETQRLDRQRWHRLEEPIAPCLVLMRTDDQDPLAGTHIGVYIGSGEMLHTSRKLGACRTAIDHPYWGQTIEGFYVPA